MVTAVVRNASHQSQNMFMNGKEVFYDCCATYPDWLSWQYLEFVAWDVPNLLVLSNKLAISNTTRERNMGFKSGNLGAHSAVLLPFQMLLKFSSNHWRTDNAKCCVPSCINQSVSITSRLIWGINSSPNMVKYLPALILQLKMNGPIFPYTKTNLHTVSAFFFSWWMPMRMFLGPVPTDFLADFSVYIKFRFIRKPKSL
jgi:hypothetical protein